jgi:hypothetical protein
LYEVVEKLEGDEKVTQPRVRARRSEDSHAKQVGLEFGVAVLLRPKVERDGGKFVDQRLGQAAFRQVDALDVGLAGVAALDADGGEIVGGVDGEFGMVFFAASGADEAAEIPFRETEAAEQAAAASVALRAKDGKRGFAMAERAMERCRAFDWLICLRAGELGAGLEEGEEQEFLRVGGGVDVSEALGEEVRPGGGVGGVEVAGDMSEGLWSFFFYQGEEFGKAG